MAAALLAKLSTLNKQRYGGGGGGAAARTPIFAYQNKQEKMKVDVFSSTSKHKGGSGCGFACEALDLT